VRANGFIFGVVVTLAYRAKLYNSSAREALIQQISYEKKIDINSLFLF